VRRRDSGDEPSKLRADAERHTLGTCCRVVPKHARAFPFQPCAIADLQGGERRTRASPGLESPVTGEHPRIRRHVASATAESADRAAAGPSEARAPVRARYPRRHGDQSLAALFGPSLTSAGRVGPDGRHHGARLAFNSSNQFRTTCISRGAASGFRAGYRNRRPSADTPNP
jgi:hypothetical protein